MMANIVLLMLGLVGIGVPLLFVIGLSREFLFGRKAQRFPGRIVDFASISGQHKQLFAPVVEWTGPDGKNRRFLGSGWFPKRRYQLGENVAVLCGFERDRVRVCVDSFAERYGFDLLTLIFASVISATLIIGFIRA